MPALGDGARRRAQQGDPVRCQIRPDGGPGEQRRGTEDAAGPSVCLLQAGDGGGRPLWAERVTEVGRESDTAGFSTGRSV